MIRVTCVVALVLVSGLAVADTLAERWAKRMESADEIYQAAVKKADDIRFFAVKKATLERVRLIKSALTDATKAGDFSAAMELQSRLEAAEKEGSVRPKPKNVAKFNGHEYFLIEDKVSWHVAKKHCEEMGGHLAIINSKAEQSFLITLGGRAGTRAWLGACNENGDWYWVDGSKVVSTEGWTINEGPLQSAGLAYWDPAPIIDDYTIGGRLAFICEWE